MAARRFVLPSLAALALELTGAGATRADIYVWSDAAGTEHYTNSLEGVPADRRDGARPFVRERPRAAPAPEPAESVAPPAPAPAEAAEDVGDRLREAYAAGREDGMAAAAPPTIIEVTSPPVIQQAAVYVEAPRAEPVIVGAFWPGHGHRHPHGPPPRHEVAASPFAIGPAGPPPLGAPGPAPFAGRRSGERR